MFIYQKIHAFRSTAVFSSSQPVSIPPVDVEGVTAPLSKLSLEESKSSTIESEVISRQGEAGRP